MHNSESFFSHCQGSFVLIRKKKKIRPIVSQTYSWHHTYTDLDDCAKFSCKISDNSVVSFIGNSWGKC